jgi:aminopeptidase YwaD
MVEIGGEAARRLEERLAQNRDLFGRLIVKARTRAGTSFNVAAFIPARDAIPGLPVIVVGAHLDSANSPGAVDNASGLACLVALARLFARAPLGLDLWLVGFGAEELGELGSRDFLADWKGGPIAAMLSLDSLGSGRMTMVYSLQGRPNQVVETVLEAGRRLGFLVEGGASEASDHLPFALAGIPAAFLMRLPEERRHSSGDRVEFVDPESLAESVALVATALRDLAQDLRGEGTALLPPPLRQGPRGRKVPRPSGSPRLSRHCCRG